MRAVGLTEGMDRENLCRSRGHAGSTDEDSQVFSFNNLGRREGGSLSHSRNGMVTSSGEQNDSGLHMQIPPTFRNCSLEAP